MDDVEHIRSQELKRTSPRAFIGIAVIAVAQIVVGVVLLDADPSYPRWRIWATAGLGLATLPLAGLEFVTAARKDGSAAHAVVPTLSVLLFGGIMAVVEGPISPMSPLLFHVVLSQAGRHGFGASARVSTAASLLIIVGLALMPRVWFGPALAEPYRTCLWAVMLGGVLLSQVIEASLMQSAYNAAARQLNDMRSAILHDNKARVRGLETIGAKVAHELKNPLTSIKALLQLMGGDVVAEKDRRRFEVLNREVARMQTILADYLSFSRPLDELRTSQLDLFALVQHIAEVLEARASSVGARLVITGESATISGDEGRLRGALLNIASNALEATSSGGRITLETRKTAEGARIMVRDPGKGMSLAQLAKLGTPFASSKDGGTGLGVIIATATIRQHGGEISFESEEGRGTCVTIDLPRVAREGDVPLLSYQKLSARDVPDGQGAA